MNRWGLTLIEILVALAVLAIGATAVAGLQLASLRLARLAEQNTRLLHAADTELQHRLLGLGSGSGCEALSSEELNGIDCLVASEGCRLLADGFECSSAFSGWPRRFTVRTQLPSGPQVTLSSVSRGKDPG